MTHDIVLNAVSNKFTKDDKTFILAFLEYLFNQLHIKEPVTIKFEPHNDNDGNIDVSVNLRLAFVELDKRAITIYCENRALLDILRSVAHELIHVQQLDLGQLKLGQNIKFYLPTIDCDGYDLEYEAYGLSGMIVRNFRAILNGEGDEE